jgi:hypothetical protein
MVSRDIILPEGDLVPVAFRSIFATGRRRPFATPFMVDSLALFAITSHNVNITVFLDNKLVQVACDINNTCCRLQVRHLVAKGRSLLQCGSEAVKDSNYKHHVQPPRLYEHR